MVDTGSSEEESYLLTHDGESQSHLPGLKVISVPHLSRDASTVFSYSSYDTFSTEAARSIRFQVVIWYIGQPDEVLGRVEMKFRVTIYWNSLDQVDPEIGYGLHNPHNNKVWKMHGRQRAFLSELSEMCEGSRVVYVPPISILNAVDHQIQGEPEVCLLNKDENLMKWSCLYKASLLQENFEVGEFPHDSHELVLRLGVLKHRQPRKRWEKSRWKLDLATRDDTHDTIETPYGTIVDHVKVPGYIFETRKLNFEFLPLAFGSDKRLQARDHCLQVKFRVMRESSYYNRNIIPLLAALNTIGISFLALTPQKFGSRGQCLLAASFVEIGIRMTVDSRLPQVGYQIKIQWVFNNFFFGLLGLCLESSFAYLLLVDGHESASKLLDACAAILESVHMSFVLMVYFIGSGSLFDRFCLKGFKKRFRYEGKVQ